jgi:hypothetical protein
MNKTPEKSAASSLSKWKKYHKWPSLFLAFSLLLFAFSGIVLNHRDFFSKIDVNRKILPKVYHYKNWNLAAVKGAIEIGDDSLLIYGNVGIWLTDKDLKAYADFNSGFPKGVDNRKTFSVFQTSGGQILAGTLSGFYRYSQQDKSWKPIHIPIKDKRILGFTQKDELVYIIGRSDIFIARDENPLDIKRIDVPHAIQHDYSVTLFRTLWVMHSGKLFGKAGQLFVDLMAAILIFLTLTGLIYFFVPKLLKRLKNKKSTASRIKSINRFSIKWHNLTGYYTVIILIIISFTGIFLRPPFLIPIANIRVPAMKYTWLDNPNPWFDRLRDIVYDETHDMFIVSTSDGFYYTTDNFASPLKGFQTEPPVSVMGINVFKKTGSGKYLVGSFSGIYDWIPAHHYISDHVSGNPLKVEGARGNPFGNIPVAGMINVNGEDYIFEYLRGAINYNGELQFPEMPEQIIRESPISLWNLSLEIHTGRIFSFLLGDFYILYIPVVGIGTMLILVSGFVIWWRKKKINKAIQIS